MDDLPWIIMGLSWMTSPNNQSVAVTTTWSSRVARRRLKKTHICGLLTPEVVISQFAIEAVAQSKWWVFPWKKDIFRDVNVSQMVNSIFWWFSFGFPIIFQFSYSLPEAIPTTLPSFRGPTWAVFTTLPTVDDATRRRPDISWRSGPRFRDVSAHTPTDTRFAPGAAPGEIFPFGKAMGKPREKWENHRKTIGTSSEIGVYPLVNVDKKTYKNYGKLRVCELENGT